jgi:hypothetical protein
MNKYKECFMKKVSALVCAFGVLAFTVSACRQPAAPSTAETAAAVTASDDDAVILPGSNSHYKNRIDNTEYSGNQDLKKVIIRDDVTEIGGAAFGDCYNLTSVFIPKSVTKIWNGAFSFCYALKDVVIENGVKFIDRGTFYKCRSLTSITLPQSVNYIGAGTFSYCPNISSITLGANVELSYDGAYNGKWAADCNLNNFPNDYKWSGQHAAGTYTWDGSNWIWKNQ